MYSGLNIFREAFGKQTIKHDIFYGYANIGILIMPHISKEGVGEIFSLNLSV